MKIFYIPAIFFWDGNDYNIGRHKEYTSVLYDTGTRR